MKTKQTSQSVGIGTRAYHFTIFFIAITQSNRIRLHYNHIPNTFLKLLLKMCFIETVTQLVRTQHYIKLFLLLNKVIVVLFRNSCTLQKQLFQKIILEYTCFPLDPKILLKDNTSIFQLSLLTQKPVALCSNS